MKMTLALVLATPALAWAGETNVAVAANFTDAAKEIARSFAKATGHQAILSFGSTGQLFTQITQQAPFQVFLSADEERPKKLIEQKLGVEGSQFTYAVGRLVLYSATPDLVKGEATLRSATFQKLAIANPATAPYGAAGVEVMKKLGVYDALRSNLVQGNDVGQTLQFVATGNAEVGFVALAQVIQKSEGSRWIVPANLYAPIHQDAVLLTKGESSEAAKAFVAYLRDPEARKIIEKHGYGLRE